MGRKIKVATVSMAIEYRKPKSIDENLKYIEKVVGEISYINPDIIVLPEVFPVSGIGNYQFPYREGKQLMKELSEKYKTYIAGSVHDKRKDGRNTANKLASRRQAFFFAKKP